MVQITGILHAGPSLAQPMPAEPAARRSIRVAIRHASVDVLAALQQEHTLSTSSASSSTPAGSIKASAADMVLMHHSDAHGPQPEGHPGTQQRAAKQIEATALTAAATLFGPGPPLSACLLHLCTRQKLMLAYPLAPAPTLSIQMPMHDVIQGCCLGAIIWSFPIHYDAVCAAQPYINVLCMHRHAIQRRPSLVASRSKSHSYGKGALLASKHCCTPLICSAVLRRR